MPTVHYASRAFLERLGVRLPPRTRAHHFFLRSSRRSPSSDASKSLSGDESCVGGNGRERCLEAIATERSTRSREVNPSSAAGSAERHCREEPSNDSDDPSTGISTADRSLHAARYAGATHGTPLDVSTRGGRELSDNRLRCDDSMNPARDHGDGYHYDEMNPPKRTESYGRDTVSPMNVMDVPVDSLAATGKTDTQNASDEPREMSSPDSPDVNHSLTAEMEKKREASSAVVEKYLTGTLDAHHGNEDGNDKEGEDDNTVNTVESPTMEKFQVNERNFAWHRGVLFKAKVLECREDGQRQRDGQKYRVRYSWLGRIQDRWLAPKDMMKLTPSNRLVYCALRGLPPDEEAPSNDRHRDSVLVEPRNGCEGEAKTPRNRSISMDASGGAHESMDEVAERKKTSSPAVDVSGDAIMPAATTIEKKRKALTLAGSLVNRDGTTAKKGRPDSGATSAGAPELKPLGRPYSNAATADATELELPAVGSVSMTKQVAGEQRQRPFHDRWKQKQMLNSIAHRRELLARVREGRITAVKRALELRGGENNMPLSIMFPTQPRRQKQQNGLAREEEKESTIENAKLAVRLLVSSDGGQMPFETRPDMTLSDVREEILDQYLGSLPKGGNFFFQVGRRIVSKKMEREHHVATIMDEDLSIALISRSALEEEDDALIDTSKPPPCEHSCPEVLRQSVPAEGTVEQTTVQEVPTIESGGEKPKIMIKEFDTYMKTWLSRPENSCNLMPSLLHKERIIQETGIEKSRLESWFYRARKRSKKQHESKHDSRVSQLSSMNDSLINATKAVSSTCPGKQHQHILKKQGEENKESQEIIDNNVLCRQLLLAADPRRQQSKSKEKADEPIAVGKAGTDGPLQQTRDTVVAIQTFNKEVESTARNDKKESYDEALNECAEKRNFKGVIITNNGKKYNTVRGLKWGKAWHDKLLYISMGPIFLVSEAAQSVDIATRLHVELMKLKTFEEKQNCLEQYDKSPPAYVNCTETSIPTDVVEAAMKKSRSSPFNFPNPSRVSAARMEEIVERNLQVEQEFTTERKQAIFRAVVKAIAKAIAHKAK